MDFLYKSIFKNVQKSYSIASVLVFFSTSGVAVLSSVDHLSENLRKGTKNINHDSNLHDLVLTSKKSGDEDFLNFSFEFENNLSEIKMKANPYFRWSFLSNSVFPLMKQKKTSSEDFEVKFDTSQHILHIPTDVESSHGNHYLMCITSKTPLKLLSKKITFWDKNDAFIANNYLNIENDMEIEPGYDSRLFIQCPETASQTDKFNNYFYYFKALKKHWNKILEENDISESIKTEYSSKQEDKKPYTLSSQEFFDLHQRNSFNPTSPYRILNDASSSQYYFAPFLEYDYSLEFLLHPKKDILTLKKRYDDIIKRIKNTSKYWKLNDTVISDIDEFSEGHFFKPFKKRLFFSSFFNLLSQFSTNFLPMIPGLSYEELNIFLTKLLLYKWIKKTDQGESYEATWPQFRQDLKTTNWENLLSLLSNTDNSAPKDFSDFKPFKKPNDHEYQSKPLNYFFSTLFAKKTIDEAKVLDSQSLKKIYNPLPTTGNLTADSVKKWCNGDEDSAARKKRDDNSNQECKNTVFEKLKENSSGRNRRSSEKPAPKLYEYTLETFKQWISGNYFSSLDANSNVSTQQNNDSGKYLIPALNGFSSKEWAKKQTDSSTSSANPFSISQDVSDSSPFRIFPTSFEEVFEFLTETFTSFVQNEIAIVAKTKSDNLRSFLESSSIFELSFLLNTFHYKPTVIRKLSSSTDSEDLNNEFNKEDTSPSVQNNNSILLSNSSNISSKLNDPSLVSHRFKVIWRNSDDNSDVNRLKIVEGNHLFENPISNLSVLKRISGLVPQNASGSYYADGFKLLSRFKYSIDHIEDYFKLWYQYSLDSNQLDNPDFFLNVDDIDKIQNFVFDLRSTKPYAELGARIFIELNNTQSLNFLNTIRFQVKVDELKLFGYLDQFSSKFGILSPQYAQKHNIRPISNTQYEKFKNLLENSFLSQQEWETEYNTFLLDSKNHDHILNINGNKIIIVGLALSPDFLLPSQSFLNSIPDIDKEALVYVDKFGFKHLLSNSLSQWTENYVSISYPQIIKEKHLEDDYFLKLKEHIISFYKNEDSNGSGEIQNLSDSVDLEAHQYPFSLTKSSDSKNNLLIYMRTNYAENFAYTLDKISSFLLLLIFLIIFFTVLSLTKQYITKNINIFGNLIANGISRFRIILTSSLFTLLPIIVGVFLGYFLSLFLQSFVFSIFANFWYLNPLYSGFNLSKIIGYIAGGCFLTLPLSWFISYRLLTPKVSVLMKEHSLFKNNQFTKSFNKLFEKASSLWKFRLIIIANTINKILVLTTGSIFLFLFSTFLFANLGKFEEISRLELISKKQGYELDFETPTEQSGQYLMRSYKNLGDTFLNKIGSDEIFLSKGNKKEKVHFDKDNPQLIASSMNSQFHYDSVPKISKYLKKLSKEETHKDDFFKEFNKKFPLFGSSPSKTLNANIYDTYLLKSYLDLKQNKNEPTNFSYDEIKDNYEIKKFPFRNIKNQTLKIFGSSSGESSKFKPNLEDWNTNDFYLGDYVPVKTEVWKENKTSVQKRSTDSQEAVKPHTPLMYGDEPLFKKLSDYYKTKEPILKNWSKEYAPSDTFKARSWFLSELEHDLESGASAAGSSNGASKDGDLVGDFKKFKESTTSTNNYHLPTLSRLYKDSANYWFISLTDIESSKTDIELFKNKVILRFLFDFDFELNFSGNTIKFNVWNEFNEFLSRYSNETTDLINENNINFISKIISSRYGSFFVNRFMTKHVLSNKTSTKENSDTSSTQNGSSDYLNNFLKSYIPGNLFNNKKSWPVLKDLNIDPKLKDELDDGLYYLDTGKAFYFYDKVASGHAEDTESETKTTDKRQADEKHHERVIMFRPDFLYLFLALMKDSDFLKDDIAPIKISFNNNIYVPDYENPLDYEFELAGDPKEDCAKKLGFVSECSDIGDEIYSKIPNGDQTYTYLNGFFEGSGFNDEIKILGLKQDHRGSYLKIYKDNKLINSKLYEEPENDVYPIIINKFAAKKLGLSVGSTIDFYVHNTYDRYTKKLKNENHAKKVKFLVKDIFDSYYSSSLFLSQKNANKILGLNENYGFNGIYTKNFEDPNKLPYQFVKGISAYSESGIYTKIFIKKDNPKFNKFLNEKYPVHNAALRNIESDNPIFQYTNKDTFVLKNNLNFTDYSNDTEKLSRHITNAFGQKFSLIPLIVNVSNASTSNDFIFSSVSDLVLSIINLFIVILSPLLVCTLFIITKLILEDLKNLLTILSLLGFTSNENSIIILLYLAIVLVLTLSFSIPLMSNVLAIYVDSIFRNISILLPISLNIKYLSGSLLLLLVIFGFSYWRSILKLKKMYLPIAMKTLND